MAETVRTCVLYCRVSTDNQGKYGTSLTEQEIRMVDYCTHNGYKILEIFKEDETGTKILTRPALEAALNKIRLHNLDHKGEKIDFFMTTKYDRSTRAEAIEFFAFKETLKNLKCGYIPVDEYVNTDDSPEGEFIETIMVGKARWERNNIVRQVTRGMVRRMHESATWVLGEPPNGFKRDEKQKGKGAKRLVPEEPAYTIINEAFSMLLTGEYAINQILKHVQSRGLVSKRSNKPITKQSLSNILHNPAYAGYLRSRKRKAKYADFDIFKEGEWMRFAMLTLDEFKRCQAIMDKNRKNKHDKYSTVNTKFAMAKFLRCGKCGRLMSGSKSKLTNAYYRCPHCKVSMSVKTADSLFYEFLKKCQPTGEMVAMYVDIIREKYKKKFTTQLNLKEAYEKEVKKLLAEKIKIKEGHKGGLYTLEEALKENEDIDNKIASFQELIANCEINAERLDQAIEYGLYNLQHLEEWWKNASGSARVGIGSVLFPKGLVIENNHIYNIGKSPLVEHLLGLKHYLVKRGDACLSKIGISEEVVHAYLNYERIMRNVENFN